MKIRRFFIFAALLGIGIVLIANFSSLQKTIGLIGQAKWYILALIVVAQAWSYFNNAKYYQSFLALFDYKLSLSRLYEASLAYNFVNQVFPSGGISGASYMSTVFKGEVPVGKMTLTQLMRFAFTFMSFLIILAVGLVLLFVKGNLSSLTLKLTVAMITAVIVLGIAAAVVISKRRRVQKVVGVLVRWFNRLVGKFRSKRKKPPVTIEQFNRFFDEFYEGYEFLLAERGQWIKPLLYTLGGSVAEIATVYIVFLAFGQVINLGVVIAGYTLANVISVVSVVTGGVGLYEATMVGAYAALGIPLPTALSVVLVYRFLNFAVFLPVGFFYYRKQVKAA
jgi:uncharacterized protein (TIRG00374 family)